MILLLKNNQKNNQMTCRRQILKFTPYLNSRWKSFEMVENNGRFKILEINLLHIYKCQMSSYNHTLPMANLLDETWSVLEPFVSAHKDRHLSLLYFQCDLNWLIIPACPGFLALILSFLIFTFLSGIVTPRNLMRKLHIHLNNCFRTQ